MRRLLLFDVFVICCLFVFGMCWIGGVCFFVFVVVGWFGVVGFVVMVVVWWVVIYVLIEFGLFGW